MNECCNQKSKCNNNVNWPLTPRHILTERVGCTNIDSTTNKSKDCGIATEVYVKGLLLGISDKLEIPTLLIEKVVCKNAIEIIESSEIVNLEKSTYKKYAATGSWYKRIESNTLYSSWSPICANLREICTLNGRKCKDACYEQDMKAAAFFFEKDNIILNENLAINALPQNEKEYSYLVYRCEQTKLVEIAVPVKLNNNVCGVFITGQLALIDDENDEKQMYAKFKELNSIGVEINIEEIKSRCLNRDKLNEKIEQILHEVNDFEKKLNDRLIIKCGELLYAKQNELLINFFKSLFNKKQDDNPQIRLDSIIDSICECLRSIIISFGLECITIFTLSTFNISARKGHLIGGRTITREANLSSSLLVDIEILQSIVKEKNGSLHNEITKDHTKSGLFKNTCLENQDIDFDNSSVHFAGVNGKGSSPVILLVNYTNKNEFIEAEPSKYTLSSLLFVLNNVFLSQLSTVYTSEKEQNLKEFIKTFTHETGQLNAGTRSVLYRHYEIMKKSNDAYKRNESENEHDHPQWNNLLDSDLYLTKSVDGLLKNIELRLRSASYRADLREPEMKFFYPYDAFLFKWKAIYSKEMEKKGMDFILPKVRANDKTRPEMYADPLMIEQVAYNLTNNAYKYAHDYTKVYLDCRLDDGGKFYVLRVSNFGNPVDCEEVEKIFNFGFRSKSAPGHTEGNGIGLYLSKKIAHLHWGTLDLISNEKISDFTVSYMEMYLQHFRNKERNDELYKRIEKDLKRLREHDGDINDDYGGKMSIYDEIINPKNPSDFNTVKLHFIDKLVLQPTARVTFELKIPYDRGN